MLPLLILHGLVPALLVAWLAFGRPVSPLGLVFRWGATVGHLLAVANAGLWLALPRFVLWVLVAAFPPAAATALRRSDRMGARAPGGRALARNQRVRP